MAKWLDKRQLSLASKDGHLHQPPPVTCLPDAMRLLATGTKVEVDGTRGVVRVLD